jgi:tRNA uridine 5-carboxymethylaminomethyl modification enzyme
MGVLVDDLVTRGVSEPYRMFTSRAEYRLHLRADNADLRLTELGIETGCVGSVRRDRHRGKLRELAALRAKLGSLSATPRRLSRHEIPVSRDGARRSAFDLLRYPGVTLARLVSIWPELQGVPPRLATLVESEALYQGYLGRQEADVQAYRRDENLLVPSDLDYGRIGGISTEAREVLARARPATLGAAARLPGITPAALVALLRHVKRSGRDAA